MNLPNKLTIGRMCAIPVVIILAYIKCLQEITIFTINNMSINLQDLILLIVFALASITDCLDGKIARKYNLVTNFGKFMDPLADKLLVLSTLIVLLQLGKLDYFGINFGFVVTIILSRELAITGLRTIAADNGVVIAASKLGKSKTVSQMAMIIMLIINCFPFWFNEMVNGIVAVSLISIATLLTIVSGIDYFAKNGHVLKNNK